MIFGQLVLSSMATREIGPCESCNFVRSSWIASIMEVMELGDDDVMLRMIGFVEPKGAFVRMV